MNIQASIIILSVLFFSFQLSGHAQAGMHGERDIISKGKTRSDLRKQRKHFKFSLGICMADPQTGGYIYHPGGWKRPEKGTYWNRKNWAKARHHKLLKGIKRKRGRRKQPVRARPKFGQ